MTTTIFKTGTIIQSTWLQDVDTCVYVTVPALASTAVLPPVPVAGHYLRSNGAIWTTSSATLVDSFAKNDMLLASGVNTMAVLSTANSSMLQTDGSGNVAWVANTTALANAGAVRKSDYTAKGDILAASAASTPAVVSVGTDGQLLSADSASAAGVKWITSSAGTTIPAGVMFDFAGAGAAPAGYLLCDGSAVSRVTYATLYAALGTTWGAGDGVTTFNVPDTRRRVTVGSGGVGTGTLGNAVGNTGGEETHVLITGELAAHSHGVTDPTHTHTVTDPHHTHTASGTVGIDSVGGAGIVSADGSPNAATNQLATTVTVTAAATGISLVAASTGITTANAGSGTAHNNMQPSIIVQKIIKT